MSGLGRVEGLPIIAVFLALIGVFMLAAPQVFLGHRIYLSFLNTVPPVLLLALGLTLVIAAGEIDLSFPSVIAFSGCLLALCVKDLELPWLGVPLALLGGALVGFTNGVLVAVVGVPSTIAALATQFFWGGLTTGISGGVSCGLRTVHQSWVHTLFAGEVIVGGIDLAPATIDGLEGGWISVTLDQQLYLQGFLPVVQCVVSAN
jgi:simple sugar transport system permease protein